MGGLKIFGPRDEVGWGEGTTCEKNLTKAKTAHLCKIRPFFAILSMKYSFLKVLLSLKVVKFGTKMYLNFSNFGGTNLSWGGDKPWSKNRDKCRMGGLTKFRRMGGPPVPKEKTPSALLLCDTNIYVYPPQPVA